MWRLRFFSSPVVRRLSSRRICGEAVGCARLLHQSRNFADDVRGFGFRRRFPVGDCSDMLRGSGLSLGTLPLLFGGIWYLKDDDEDPARKMALEEDMKEEDMKKRFEDWMIMYDRRYKDDEEKAWRYQIFKNRAQRVDQLNANPKGATYKTGDLSDRTWEEVFPRSCD